MITAIQRKMLDHPAFLPIHHHADITLAVTSDPFPPAFNPHHADGVEYRAVSTATGTDQSTGKGMMGLYAFYDGIKEGYIKPETEVVESSSGNTGPEMQKVAQDLGIRMHLVLRDTMPTAKFDRARVLRDRSIKIHLGGASLAREMGTQPGFYNPDQYGRAWNPYAQYAFVAPQVFAGNEDAAALFALGGSCGMPLGLARYAEEAGLRTQVKMVVAAGDDDLSGGKNLQQIKDDILHDVFSVFPESSILTATRNQSNMLSWLSWPYVVKRDRGLRFMLGQSFGSTVAGAFRWVEAQKLTGNLDKWRGPSGKVVILTLGLDDYQGYASMFLSELKDKVLNGPRTLPVLEDLLAS